MSEKETLYCGFCGKSQHDVRKLIAGPTSFICNECVKLCADICDPVEARDLRKWALEQAHAYACGDFNLMLGVASRIEAHVSAIPDAPNRARGPGPHS